MKFLILITLLSFTPDTDAAENPSYCETLPKVTRKALKQLDAASNEYESLRYSARITSARAKESDSAKDEAELDGATFSSTLTRLSARIQRSKEKIIFSLLTEDRRIDPKKKAEFSKWLACPSIRERINDDDIERPTVQRRIEAINNSHPQVKDDVANYEVTIRKKGKRVSLR